MRKRAVLGVSFGTSHRATRERTLDVMERELGEAYPEREFRRAYTSPTIRRILRERDGIAVDSVEESLKRLLADGYEDVLVQTTHVIPGFEYEGMRETVDGFRGQFSRICCGEPLLSSEEDYRSAARILGRAWADRRQEGTDIVLMGHGTEHAANAAYLRLQQALFAEGLPDFLVGTVEASPTLEHMMELAKDRSARRVVLAPFLVVAGEHAVHDMAGDQADSWKSRCLRAGYQVECVMRGLGEYPEIRAMYLEHARRAERG